MLFLRCSGLLVLSCVDYIEVVPDPRHWFKIKRQESQMVEAVIYVSFHLFTTWSPFVQLTSYEAQHCFVNRAKNKKRISHSSVSLDTGEQDRHNGEEFVSNR